MKSKNTKNIARPFLPPAARRSRHLVLAAGLLALAASLPAAAQAEQIIDEPLPVAEYRQLVVATEGEPATVELERILAGAGAAGYPVEVGEEPSLGAWQLDGTRLTYLPEPGRFGRDQMLLEAGPILIRLELRLLPRFLPFAGRLAPGPVTLGVYDNSGRRFLLCAEPAAAEPEKPRNCRWLAVRGLRTARSLVPVAWPSDKFGGEQAALYDMATGDLIRLGLDSTGTYLLGTDTLRFGAAAIGAWPVVGKWRASEAPEMALVFEDGRVSFPAEARQTEWPAVPAADPRCLLLPVRLPAALGGRDRMAFFDPKFGDIEWLAPEDGGGTGFEPHLGLSSDYSRPLAFVSSLTTEGELLPSFSFFQQDPQGSLVLIPGYYLIGKPQTIPIKFPDDPPTSP